MSKDRAIPYDTRYFAGFSKKIYKEIAICFTIIFREIPSKLK
jgi:hypothetical protein